MISYFFTNNNNAVKSMTAYLLWILIRVTPEHQRSPQGSHCDLSLL